MLFVLVALLFCYLCAESVRRGAFSSDREIAERAEGGGDCGFIMLSLIVAAILFVMLAAGSAGGVHG